MMLRYILWLYVPEIIKSIINGLITVGEASYRSLATMLSVVSQVLLFMLGVFMSKIETIVLVIAILIMAHPWVVKPVPTTPEDLSNVILIDPKDYGRLVYIPYWMSDNDKVLQNRAAISREHILSAMFDKKEILDAKKPAHKFVKVCAADVESATTLVECVASKLRSVGYTAYKDCVADMSLNGIKTLFIVNVCLAAVTDMEFADTAETTILRDENGHATAVLYDDDF